MNVAEIIDLVAEFSASGSNATEAQRSIFLKYLNLYKDKLYRDTALINKDVLQYVELAKDYNKDIGLTFCFEEKMQIVSVFDFKQQKFLLEKSKPEAIALYRGKVGEPLVYSFVKTHMDASHTWCNQLSLYPVPASCDILVRYILEPASFEMTTPSRLIPFPPAFHQLLVDGTLWYVFQEEGGFRDSSKAKEAKDRCSMGEQELVSYLVNAQPDQSEAMNGI